MSYTSISYADFVKEIKNGRKDFARFVINAPKSKKKAAKKRKNPAKIQTLEGLSFQNAVFPKGFAFFEDKCLKKCNFDFAVLNEASFARTQFKAGCSFERASLQNASFNNATGEEDTVFSYADMRFTNMKGAIFKGAKFSRVNLNEAEFNPKSTFDGADFRSASLCFLRKANTASWKGANLDDALIERSRAGNRFKGVNLSGIRSSGQIDNATKQIYMSVIANAFSVKGQTLRQKKDAEKRIIDYAVSTVDKLGLRHSAPSTDKNGLFSLRITSKNAKSQKLLRELHEKVKELNEQELQSNYSNTDSDFTNAANISKIKEQSR